jgi:multidrug efflux pump subunit AcrA (membrane-fusion protein)
MGLIQKTGSVSEIPTYTDRILNGLFGLAVAGLGVCVLGCAKSVDREMAAAESAAAPRISVRLAQAASSDVAASIELVGTLIPRRRTIIVSEVDGVILEISDRPIEAEIDGQQISETTRLDIGVEVSDREVLVRLDPEEYELRLQSAEARLSYATRELEKLMAWRRPEEIRCAKAARDEAAARLVPAESNLKRVTSLVRDGATSQAQYDQAEADVKAAQAALARAEAELAVAEAGPTKEDIAVAQAAVRQAESEVDLAKWALGKTEIQAPYAGVVTDRFVDKGERVTAMPRVEIMELMDISILSAQLGVPERYIGRIQVGDPAMVYVKGSVEPVRGMVALVNDKVDASSRTFRIRVGIRNDERRFKAGQFVRVALQVESSQDALTVPAEAITYTGGEAHVFVYDAGRVRQRPVTLGVGNEEIAEVLSGLAAGEQVVVDDPSVLCDGMLVQVQATDIKTQVPASAI